MKTWRNNRVIKVDRRLLVGSDEQLDDALFRSEDSSKLNTAFIERLNLTIRQGSAYLSRRSPCHARYPEHLEGHLELLRCYYNFIRPHRGLKFGKEMRTPAMQAGLTKSDAISWLLFLSVLARLVQKIVRLFQDLHELVRKVFPPAQEIVLLQRSKAIP